MELTKLGCVILAAGSSTRLGTDKALISVGSKPLIRWLYDRLARYNFDIVIVVNESNFSRVSEVLPRSKVIVNYEPNEGRTGSLKKGISNLDVTMGDDYPILVVPVDRPGFSNSTLHKIIEFGGSCCPALEGKGGHPLLLSSNDVSRVRMSPSDIPLREIIKPKKIQVSDRYLHLNIDTQRDLKGLKEKLEFVNEEN